MLDLYTSVQAFWSNKVSTHICVPPS